MQPLHYNTEVHKLHVSEARRSKARQSLPHIRRLLSWQADLDDFEAFG